MNNLLCQLCLSYFNIQIYIVSYQELNNNVNVKVHPRICYEGIEGEYRYSSTFSLTSALYGGGWSMPRPRKRPGANCTGG